MAIVLGIDGARGGWVACRLDGTSVEIVCFRDHELAEALAGVDQAWIDMPLGLPRGHLDFPRRCDVALRQRLGRRASSVFTCPIRSAVYAPDYRDACRINAEATGQKISLQAWNLCPKIRLVDQFLQTRPPIMLQESHPEYNFQCLKGEPLTYPKKTREGQQERLEGVLRAYHPEVADYITTQKLTAPRGVRVLMDDILDAAVLAVSAWWALENGAELLPESESQILPVDAWAIPMQIVAPLQKNALIG